jgi:hypothetical protein
VRERARRESGKTGAREARVARALHTRTSPSPSVHPPSLDRCARMWQDQQSQGAYGGQGFYGAPQGTPLQFYSPTPGAQDFYAARPSLDGQLASTGQIGAGGGAGPGYAGAIQAQGPWWAAFGTGGFEGEPPLLEGARARRVVCVRAIALTAACARARDQLWAHPREESDGPEPVRARRRAHHGRRGPRGAHPLLPLLRHLPPLRASVSRILCTEH